MLGSSAEAWPRFCWGNFSNLETYKILRKWGWFNHRSRLSTSLNHQGLIGWHFWILICLTNWCRQNGHDTFFLAGDIFSKAHHFWYPFMKFRGCIPRISQNKEIDPLKTHKKLGEVWEITGWYFVNWEGPTVYVEKIMNQTPAFENRKHPSQKKKHTEECCGDAANLAGEAAIAVWSPRMEILFQFGLRSAECNIPLERTPRKINGWNLRIWAPWKRNIIWTKPSFWSSMLIFWGVPKTQQFMFRDSWIIWGWFGDSCGMRFAGVCWGSLKPLEKIQGLWRKGPLTLGDTTLVW